MTNEVLFFDCLENSHFRVSQGTEKESELLVY